MSLPQETLLQLMALADGELEGDERARIEALVARDPQARQVVDSIRSPALGEWLGQEMQARSASAERIADAVMASLADASEVVEVLPSKVHTTASTAGAEGGAVVRFARPVARRSSGARTVGGALVGVLALAAGVVLYFTSVSPSGDEARSPVASVGTPNPEIQPVPVAPSAAVAVLPSQGVEVDEVDSPSRGFSVFEIPVGGVAGAAGAAKAAGPSSVVIMIDDDPGAK
jgi:hypothetical protein